MSFIFEKRAFIADCKKVPSAETDTKDTTDKGKDVTHCALLEIIPVRR